MPEANQLPSTNSIPEVFPHRGLLRLAREHDQTHGFSPIVSPLQFSPTWDIQSEEVSNPSAAKSQIKVTLERIFLG